MIEYSNKQLQLMKDLSKGATIQCCFCKKIFHDFLKYFNHISKFKGDEHYKKHT